MVDSLFIESRNFQLRDIARAFDVPPYELAIEGETESPARRGMARARPPIADASGGLVEETHLDGDLAHRDDLVLVDAGAQQRRNPFDVRTEFAAHSATGVNSRRADEHEPGRARRSKGCRSAIARQPQPGNPATGPTMIAVSPALQVPG